MNNKIDEGIIEVVDVEDQDDGSAIVTLDMNERGRDLLIQEGFISILKNHMEESIDGEDQTCD
jgi:hypothetical protein